MKVALVCPYAWDRFGGVQSHIATLASTLRTRGHEVLVIAPHSSHGAVASDEVTIVGRAVPVPANGSIASLSFGPLAAAGVRKALRGFAPDLVHLHEPLVPSLSLLGLWSAKVPAVGTFHASAESSLGYRLARPVLERAVDRLAARTAVSDAARALIARYFPGEYLLTPNGIDAARFAEAHPIEPRSDRKKILFFGRIERRKGLEVLVQAMTRAREIDVELIVAGAGPEETSCRKLARSLAVPVRFVGRVSEADKPRWFRAADVYCAPAVGGESFGIVLLEAMAAGAPVVCSDLPGFRAVAGDAARLVPAGDPGALADALRDVLTDDDERTRLGAAARRRARMFDWERLVTGVESVYDRALGTRT